MKPCSASVSWKRFGEQTETLLKVRKSLKEKPDGLIGGQQGSNGRVHIHAECPIKTIEIDTF